MLTLKGIIIGIGKIIPGVSGSMLAISLGVYQELITAINCFFKNPKKHISFLLKIGVGIAISILLFSKIISKSLSKSYIITVFFFIGLIIGGFNDIKKRISKKNGFIIVLFFILVLCLGLLNTNNEITIQNRFIEFIFYIIVGFIDAITMVIPGISGTATLMMIGAYGTVINTLSNLTNISMLFQNLQILMPFGIGLIIGTMLTAKLIDYLFKYHEAKTYSAIIGFSLSTIIIMAINCLKSNYTLLELIIAFILLILGIIISKSIYKLNK